MGHFNLGCGISNLSIEEDDAIGFMILGPGKSPDPRMPVGIGISHYVYATDLFTPYLPPVFGTYSGYGAVENLESSKTTEVLEEIFGIPASEVIDIINENSDLYDVDSKIFKNFYKGSRRFNSMNATAEEALVPLGFKKMENIDENTQMFVYGDFAITVRKEEGSPFDYWGLRFALTPVSIVPEFWNNHAAAALNIFARRTGLTPGYPEEVQEKVKTLNNLHGMFFLKEVFTEMDTYLKVPGNRFTWGKPDTQKWDEFIAVMNAADNDPAVDGDVFMDILEIPTFAQKATSLEDKYRPLLRKYEGTYEYLNIHGMMDIMIAVNRMFMPSFCGEQDGNNDASTQLNEVTGNILAKRKARWDDED